MAKGESSYSIEPPPAYSLHQHACITLNATDRIRLIQFSSDIIEIVRQAIEISWLYGIQREEYISDAYEFKLCGNPWRDHGDEGIYSRHLISHVLSALYNHGWNLLISTDLSRKVFDKDALFFQHGIIPSPASFFAISFDRRDRMCFIGMPIEHLPDVQQSLDPSDIQAQDWIIEDLAYEFKLYGNPWNISTSEESIYIHTKLLSLLDCLARSGWKLYASIDMTIGYQGRDTDTWIFRRDIP